jgi:thioredoxin 1
MMPWVEQLAERYADQVTIVKLNSEADRRFAVELSILGLPTVILYCDGQEVQRLSGGNCTPSTITDVVRSAISRSASR